MFRLLLDHNFNQTAGLPLPGVVVIHKEIPVGQAVEWLEIFFCCSEPEEWTNQVVWLRL